eukprot:TRINITY_DN8473_c0_g1_i2.p2 TRINITY_DN8473_c0_g1~~TRINITY_DN8473_c0_g1_i2.p2  ORF type:complete len:120 (+),score=0.61 TRINITY_DN8473_c0_g1_i2:267-626(+)
MVLCDLLKRRNMFPIKALSGKDAIEIFERVVDGRESCPCAIRLVFMDCNMPELDGYETTTLLCEWFKVHPGYKCPIVACTAYVGTEEVRRCYVHGMIDVVHKPLSIVEVERVLKSFNLM